MKRRYLLVASGSALIGGGCLASEDQSNDSPTESPTDSPTKSPSPSATQTRECQYYALLVYNNIPRKVTARITITANSRYRGGSPTPTKADNASPTETPVETFSDTITLDVDGNKKYEQVEVTDSDSLLEVTVEDGPEGKFDIEPRMVAGNNDVFVNLNEDEITFSASHTDC